MSDEYLWNRTGEPDPEIERLETMLERFRHGGETLEFPAVAYLPRRRRIRWTMWAPGVTAALAILVWVAIVWLAHRRPAPTGISQRGWSVDRIAGTPRLGNRAMANSGTATLSVGQTLETDSRSRASLSISDTGEIQVEPDSELRVVVTTRARKSLALIHGTIHAMIWAPPGQFVVETPSATAVDLGCAYTLHVDDSGAGLLETAFGWVGFQFNGHDSFVPAGAECRIGPRIGPGTPFFADASKPFQEALEKLDFAAGTAEERRSELSVVLSQARKRDALTLWHLLSRVNETERVRVYDRLAQLVPPPPQVTRAGVLRLDRRMLDLWWNELRLGNMAVWRAWERSWPEEK